MKKYAISLITVLFSLYSYAQTYGEIGIYKAYFFDLGQDLSRPLDECQYSLLKKGSLVEILDVDTMDVFHVTVKYKKKTGIIHTGTLTDKSILIPFFPQIREKYVSDLST